MVVAEVNILEEAQFYVNNIIEQIMDKHNKEHTNPAEYLCIFTNFSNRLSRRLGYCKTNKYKSSCDIYFSNLFLKSCWSNGDKEAIREVVIHEVAHAIVRVLYGFGHGHDEVFAKTVTRLGGNLISRRSASIGEGYKPYRYIYKCPNCNKVIRSKRKRVGACAKCCDEFNNGEYTDKYKWILVEDKGKVENWN